MNSASLGDVADVFNGKTPAKSEQRQAGHPVLKIRDVDDHGRFRGSFGSFVDENFVSQFDKKKVLPGDTLILNAAHNADYVGSKSFFAAEDVSGALATGEWLLVRPNHRRLDPGFAHYWLTSAAARAAIRDQVKGIHLYPKDVARLSIPLPPLDEQRRIAAILDKADALRRKRKRIVDLISAVPQSLFTQMFGDPQANPNRWNKTTALSEVADIGSGITKGRKEPGGRLRAVPYLAVANVQDRALDLSSVKTIDASEEEITRFRLRDGDLVVTEGGDPDKLGRGTVWRSELPEAIHQNHIFRIRADQRDVHPVYLSYLIGSRYGKSYFLRSAKQTTGIASINKSQLSQFPVLLPPLDLQLRFAFELAKLKGLEVGAGNALADTGNLFASLQHRAFSGQL